ncbi:ABC-2 type transport system ATP-binding protein [Pedobacter sp. ok626]|uniref:ABC transporter ATP-binding protein n=1 Tax=Pedobacter sp. ok626 TaxID=1761882 RepID=UPI00087F9185|nr:ABC transporter ATP-binding protein [Pedobacter sp. ok626]SDL10431.1 ABC-2 type transport system ATP-binding protein [Pedobacter sp. ok626]
MEKQILRIEGLSHKYSNNWAIRDINLEIGQHGILGLLGSNGAGKSTTMNIMCGVLNQTQGKVFINGIDMAEHPNEAKKLIGFLPQQPPLYMDLTVEEYLIHCAWLRLIGKTDIKNAVGEAMERCGITHFRSRLIKNLSGGYRQRVGIAQAIIHHPALVVLDEPTNGLDPNQIVEVRALIKEIALDRSVIFSSHILSEVQVLCSNITMIEGGKIVFADTMDAFNNYVEPHSLMVTMRNPPPDEQLLALSGITKIEHLTDRQMRIFFSGDDNDITENIIEASVGQRWQLKEINVDKSSIDEIFAQLSNNPKSKN